MGPQESTISDGIEILVVEDSPTQSAQLEYILQQDGYHVSIAGNGKEALSWLSRHIPALVISDIVMPEMDGYELCRQITMHENLKAIPVILLTSLSEAGDVLKGLGCGADSFIVKPYDEEYLRSQVRRVLANRHWHREEEVEAGIEIDFAGNRCLIHASRQKILNLLLSTYETAVQKNLELIRTQNELQILNEQLEDKVKERTATLTSEIAERRRAEDSLRKSEEKYRELVENANSIIMRMDVEGKITFFNEFAQGFFGYSEDEILGQEVIGTIVPSVDSSGNDLSAKLRDILKNPERYANLKSENVRRNGDRVWVAWTNRAILNQDGELDGILSVGNDITDRKHAEELLRFDEARFMALLDLSRMRDASSQEITEFTLEQGVRATSSKVGFIARMNEDETVASLKAWSKAVVQECALPDKSLHFPVEGGGLWAEAIRKRKVVVVNDYSDRTPEHRGYPPGHVSLSRFLAVPVFDRDRIVAVAAVANKEKEYDASDVRQLTLLMDGMWKLVQHNMSEEALRQSEEQLRNSNAMLQEVFDGISDPLIMLDSKLLVKILNKAAREYYGLANYDDAFGRPCFEAFLGRLTPCPDCYYPLSVTEEQAATFERKSPLDPNRFERVVVYPVLNEMGERDAAIIRISDITQAKLMERQFVQSEKLASLGLLVSGVAHEINNPNSFISFNIPILRDYLQELMPIIDGYAMEHPDLELFCMKYQEFRQDIFKLLDNVEHGSKRINRIVSDLKEYARKRDITELRWLEFKEVIEKAVNICHAEIRKKIKSFEVQIAEDTPSIFSDPEALEQVLVNLLINAVHASDKRDSWIRLSVGCEKSPGACCLIEVSDNGCGMDEKVRGKIFDPFFTTKAPSSGTGLGLYVSYTLVDALGGKIEVDSEPGKGSTFRIVLQDIEQRARKSDTVE